MSPLLFALGVALAFPTPVAPLQRRGDASFAGLLVRDRTNITWLEQLVIAPGAKLTRATVTLGEWVHPA